MQKQGKAKPVHRILIKGFWHGIKEDFWDLPEKDVEKFADEGGIVYAICVYENGKPKYSLVSKRLWLNFEEIGKILNNPNLSDKQKNEKVKKILNICSSTKKYCASFREIK